MRQRTVLVLLTAACAWAAAALFAYALALAAPAPPRAHPPAWLPLLLGAVAVQVPLHHAARHWRWPALRTVAAALALAYLLAAA